MTLFEKLFIAHFVADWLLQTEWQALNKGRSYRALFSHIGIYSLVMLGVLAASFGFRNWTVYGMVGMLAVTHSILDHGGFVAGFMKTFRLVVNRDPERWLSMAVDQVFHILLIALVTTVLSG